MKKFINQNIIQIGLGIVLVISLCLRIYQLGNTPHGLHNDEVANTYGTRFILLNGQDMYGNRWPLLYLDKFGDYPPILPMYLSGLGTFILGNNEWGSRILIALVGALLVVPVYFIALIIFKNKETAFYAALVTATAPVHVALSRLNAEGIVGLTVYMTALLALLISLRRKNVLLLVVSLLFHLLTYLLYPSYRIIVPLFLLPTIILAKYYKVNKTYIFILLGAIFLSFATTFAISSTFWGKGRFEQTSITSPVSGVQIKLQTLIFNEKNIVVARIFNNKIVGYGKEFITQYFSYFSPNYLFGDEGFPKMYTTPNTGLLYLSLIPFLLFGIVGFVQSKNKAIEYPPFIYLLYLVIVAPIPAALTVLEVPSIQRSLVMFVLLIMISAYGYNGMKDITFKRLPIKYIFLLIFLVEFIFFSHNYFTHASYYTSNMRNDGNKEMVQYIAENKNNYDAIYVTNKELWLPAYYLFYTADYNASYIGTFRENFRKDTVNNIHFVEHNCPHEQIMQKIILNKKLPVTKKILIVDNIDCPLDTPIERLIFVQDKTIVRKDFTRAFEIVKINPDFADGELNKLLQEKN